MNRWSNGESDSYVKDHPGVPECLALQTYATGLLGGRADLALHGGGNTSVKTTLRLITGEERGALMVKASGVSLDKCTPESFVALDLPFLAALKGLSSLDDNQMRDQFGLHMLRPHLLRPSIETLLHAFLPFVYIDHTHPDAILALTNRQGGERYAAAALGERIAVISYVKTGFELARAAAEAVERTPDAQGLVIAHHGLVTWGTTAREAYEATIETVERAQAYLESHRARSISIPRADTLDRVKVYRSIAPIIRGALSAPSGNPDRPFHPVVLTPLCDPATGAFLSAPEAKKIMMTAPPTSDYLIRTRRYPLWIESPALDNPGELRKQLDKAVGAYVENSAAYVERHAPGLNATLPAETLYPRIVCLPGLGIVCAGNDIMQSSMIRDIVGHSIAVKKLIYETDGNPRDPGEDHLFDMEFRSYQRAKIAESRAALDGAVAVVTGAAGAIGMGIAEALLENGCHVAFTDLPGAALETAVSAAREKHGSRAVSIPFDVTDQVSAAEAFGKVCGLWGGIDIAIVNAGIAHVSPLIDMDLERFRRLEKVNVDGALITISGAAAILKKQGTGGDIVLVSTKNVFAPGAKFGAYSATKAAAHQLARIASLELAELGVRVNMVSPDAVFSHGDTRSGLWAEVGPDRMKARGLDEKGLEEYYRSRNLLKARITAEHVGRAVLFFVTRRTPTTGATIPVDGGLPDAAPR